MSNNYYHILDISEHATPEEIKKAYRKKAVKFHPDKNPDDDEAEEKFRTATEAYTILSDTTKRKEYDRGGNPPPGFANFGDFFTGDLSDIFDKMYGSDFSGKGRNYTAQVTITLKEAYFGATRQIDLNGTILNIDIPAGVYDGQHILYPEYGEMGRLKKGDFTIVVTVLPDILNDIIRRDDHLFTSVNIDMYTALLGGTVLIPTYEGNIPIKINKGNQNGQTIEVKGRGMPMQKMSSAQGNLYIKTNIIMPETLTDEQLELIKMLQSLNNII